MERKEVIQALEKLGLSNYESKAYLAILSESPLTGYKLSKASGVPRSRIYETIEKLTAKGLVVTQDGEITLIKPISFESFLERKEKENKHNISFLRDSLSKLKKPIEDQGIWNISGRDQIIETINRLISLSKNHLYIFGSSDDLCFFEEEISKAEQRKVNIFGVYYGEKIFEVGKFSSHQGQGCSSCQDIALSIDSKQALAGFTSPVDDANVALTKNLGVIYIIEQYIKHEIFISKIFNILDKEPLEILREIYQKIIG